MKNKKLKVSYKIILMITFILIYTSTVFVLSAINTDNYNSLLIIDRNGTNSIAPLFKSNEQNNDSLFYPGYSAESTLRIRNDLDEDVYINQLGMDIALIGRYEGEGVLQQENDRYKAFMDNMIITIRYKNVLTNLIEGKLFNGTFKEFKEHLADTNVKVKKGNSVDLVYTIEMLETNKNQNNTSGIIADIVFNFNVEGKESPGDSDEIKDVPKAYWAHDCIVSLLRAQLITGYEDGTIKPERYITREEVAVVLARAVLYKELNIQELPENYETIYKDRISNWALEYVNITTFNNIFNGYPDNTFKGTKNITREEVAKVVALAFNKELTDNYKLNFSDEDEISSWSLPYVKALVRDNIITGYPDSTFKAQDNITRAEFFTIVCKELGLHDKNIDGK